mmetsp:Transcript_10895/g.15622  ORF Transcript_10895/g.15622 Transcript_10895/m.15622 type:complete len:212 (+) Transcript_10895:77-712(+)
MNVSTCSALQVRLRLSIPDSVNHYSRYFSSVIFTGRTRRRWGFLQALCAVRSMRSCSSSRMFKSRVEISTFHTHILKDDGSRINDLRRVSFDLFRLFGTTASSTVLFEKLFSLEIEIHAVLRARKTVSFIGVENVFYGRTHFVHRRHHLVGLGLFDARVVCSLRYEQRFDHLLRMVERRALAVESIVIFHVTDTQRKHLFHWRPVGRDRLQ